MFIYNKENKIEKVKKQAESVVIPKRKLHLVSLFFVFILSLGTIGVSVSNIGVLSEVKHITSSWQPNVQDLGKLKFVVKQETYEDVFLEVSQMEIPFESAYFEKISEETFLVNGLGGMIVKACLEGKVSKIEMGDKKTVYISHGKGLTTVYSDIDTLGVKEGDKVEKNTPIGVSLNSVISFKLLFRNKPIGGIVVKDGEMQFL